MVSVIVPVYNSKDTLSACVRSILDQTYSDIELILVDDGSADGSGKICDDLRETCAKMDISCQVIHKANGGVSSARNCGMEHANGEYFACVDSDDVVEPCYIEDLVRTAEEHPEIGHVVCGFRCISHAHDYILTNLEPLSIKERSDYMRLYDKVLIQSPCLGLYRTEIVRENRIRMREDLCLGEDLLFNLEYLDVLGEVRIGVINKTNYIYQDMDQDSLNRKFRHDLFAIRNEIDLALEYYLKKWGIEDEDSWNKYYNAVYYDYLGVLNNTFNKRNPMNLRERIVFNNRILEQERFLESVRKCTASIPNELRKAYESGDYKRVLAVEKLQRIKRFVRGIFKKH